jgi:SAM-dependent methyltransferase
MVNKYRNKYSRYGMYTKIEKALGPMELKRGRCLVIGDTLKGKGANPTLPNMIPQITEIDAPDYPEVDMQDLPYEDNTYQYVLTDQVLEHVRKPWVGVSEIHRVLKPGGIAIITSALMFPQHGVPYDYFRFTPDGLRVLCEDFSKIHDCNGNGSLDFVHEIFMGDHSPQVKPGSVSAKYAMANDNKFLVSVWIIAEK